VVKARVSNASFAAFFGVTFAEQRRKEGKCDNKFLLRQRLVHITIHTCGGSNEESLRPFFEIMKKSES